MCKYPKEKGKSLKTTRSDDEFDDSEEDDDNVSNYVGFPITTKKLVNTVTTYVATLKIKATISDDIAICEESDPKVCEDSKSNKSDEEEPRTEDIQEAHQEMYDNWIKVCNVM